MGREPEYPEANDVLRVQADEQAKLAARGVESLIARNALALRIAANGRVDGNADACAANPAVSDGNACRRPTVRTRNGRGAEPICEVGRIPETKTLPLVAPGDVALRISPDQDALVFRLGVSGGMATGALSREELRRSALDAAPGIDVLILREGSTELPIIIPGGSNSPDKHMSNTLWPIAGGRLQIAIGNGFPIITTGERLLLFLPFLMWIVAALLTWLLVSRLLIRPLRQLQRSVVSYEPGGEDFKLPQKLGPATEIQELRDAFQRAFTRADESEREMAGALEGQRRLVREVHHRVKNNLQVIASLINIHGRSAESPHARAAYGSISRRVGALSIVHRNHFAEMEENRGDRPQAPDLGACGRVEGDGTGRSAWSPHRARPGGRQHDPGRCGFGRIPDYRDCRIRHAPDPRGSRRNHASPDQRTDARLALNSRVLNPDDEGDREKVQFERIIAGLAKQLRSPLERKLGRYSVDLPVFPPRDL